MRRLRWRTVDGTLAVDPSQVDGLLRIALPWARCRRGWRDGEASATRLSTYPPSRPPALAPGGVLHCLRRPGRLLGQRPRFVGGIGGIITSEAYHSEADILMIPNISGKFKDFLFENFDLKNSAPFPLCLSYQLWNGRDIDKSVCRVTSCLNF